MLGAVDVASVVQIRLQLQQALRAGAQYALAYPTQNGAVGAPNSGIVQAIQQALPNLPNATPATPQMSSGPPYYMTLSVSCPYSPLLILPPVIQNSITYVIQFQ
jgi:Flp pilus assembly protein TadG